MSNSNYDSGRFRGMGVVKSEYVKSCLAAQVQSTDNLITHSGNTDSECSSESFSDPVSEKISQPHLLSPSVPPNQTVYQKADNPPLSVLIPNSETLKGQSSSVQTGDEDEVLYIGSFRSTKELQPKIESVENDENDHNSSMVSCSDADIVYIGIFHTNKELPPKIEIVEDSGEEPTNSILPSSKTHELIQHESFDEDILNLYNDINHHEDLELTSETIQDGYIPIYPVLPPLASVDELLVITNTAGNQNENHSIQNSYNELYCAQYLDRQNYFCNPGVDDYQEEGPNGGNEPIDGGLYSENYEEGFEDVAYDAAAAPQANIDPNVLLEEYSMREDEIIDVFGSYKANSRGDIFSDKFDLTRDSQPRVLISQKGAHFIFYQDQVYRPKYFSKKKNIFIARCTYQDDEDESCSGSLTINAESGVVESVRDCLHNIRREEIAMKILRQQAIVDKLRGTATRVAFRNLKRKADEYKISPPKKNTFSKTINRKCFPGRENGSPPSIDWTSSTLSNAVPLIDTSGDPNHVVIGWAAKGFQDYARNAKIIYSDGLMSKIPTGFLQMLTVSIELTEKRKIVPIAFFLCSKKDFETYRICFESLNMAGMAPSAIVTDFEVSIAEGATKVFGPMDIWYCSRHLKVSWARRLRDIVGIKCLKTTTMREFLKKCYCLLFSPIPKLSEYFVYLQSMADSVSPKLAEFMVYINRNYVGHNHLPRYSPKVWNLHERAAQKLDWTNNLAESLNAMYTRSVFGNELKYAVTAISNTVEITEEIYEDLDQNRVEDYTKKNPQFKNEEILKKMALNYATASEFIGALRPSMTIPCLY